MRRKKGFYSISAVAKMFSVHQQTIRLYEKEGLICPKRSEGNTRLFSEEDVDKLEHIIYLTHELGINLAGVEMILRLQKQIKKSQKEINRAFESTKKELDSQEIFYKQNTRNAAQSLALMKNKHTNDPQHEGADPSSPLNTDVIDLEPWHIEYEE